MDAMLDALGNLQYSAGNMEGTLGLLVDCPVSGRDEGPGLGNGAGLGKGGCGESTGRVFCEAGCMTTLRC